MKKTADKGKIIVDSGASESLIQSDSMEPSVLCRYCGRPIDKARLLRFPTVVSCSNICGRTRNRKPAVICSADRGAESELLVSADLISRGLKVFRAVSPAGPFDVISYDGTNLLRFEVTTGYRQLNGSLTYNDHSKSKDHFDHLAVVYGNEITYIPELKYPRKVGVDHDG